jgi:hypothetical protein
MKRKILTTTVEEVFEYGYICCDVPLLIRLMEFAREEAKSDVELHLIAEKMIEESKDGEVLTMKHYDKLVPDTASE